jgi:hypothetical protein
LLFRLLQRWPAKNGEASLPLRMNVFAFGLWATVLVLDLSGIVRGEVGRIWIFLMPLGLLAVAREIGRGRIGPRGFALLAVSQTVACTFIVRYWRGFY